MEWTRSEEGEGIVWTRSDENAFVRLRQTATGRWAVSLDRLRQAHDGETYRQETFEDRADAERCAERWRS